MLFFLPLCIYARSYYAPFWFKMCSYSSYNINSCPFCSCYTQSKFDSPGDTTDVILTLLDSSFLFAQCTGLDVGESFGLVIGFDVVDTCCESKDTFYVVHNLAMTLSEVSCDAYLHHLLNLIMTIFSPIQLIIPIFLHVFLLPSSTKYYVYVIGRSADNFMSLGYFLVNTMPPFTHIAYTQWTSLEKSLEHFL